MRNFGTLFGMFMLIEICVYKEYLRLTDLEVTYKPLKAIQRGRIFGKKNIFMCYEFS